MIRILSSSKFSYFLVFIFLFQGSWLAFSLIYPIPFDESYHFKLIQLYSDQLSPLFLSQPEEASQLGDITRNGSFLFHYLLSFPYRLVELATDNTTLQIIFLRLVNVLIVALGLLAFIRLFKDLRVPRITTNMILACLISIPIFPLLATNINYDNLLFLILPLNIHYLWKVIGSKRQSIDTHIIFWAFTLAGCLVKFSYVPIALVIVVYYLTKVLRNGPKQLISQLRKSIKVVPRKRLLALSAVLFALITALVLTYGVNLVKYQKINPNCEQVQPVQVCSKSFVWSRNQRLKNEQKLPPADPVRYTFIIWMDHMTNNTLAAGANTTERTIEPAASPMILYFTMWGLLVGSVLMVSYYWRELRTRPLSGLFLVIILVYTLVLWANLYQTYLTTGRPLAIQPRYLLLILPLALFFAVEAWRLFFSKRKTIGLTLIVLVFLLATQGGGFTTFLLKSRNTWYWQNTYVISANEFAQKVVKTYVLAN